MRTVNLLIATALLALQLAASAEPEIKGSATSPAGVSASETNHLPAKIKLPGKLYTFLTNADEFVLFSLNPVPDFEHKSTNTFQNHIILGHIQIRRPATKASLVSALNKGIEDKGISNGGLPAPLPGCFNPRHGIRVRKGDETIEFLICFECAQIQVSSNKGQSWFFTTSKEPSPTFNRILKQNGVPLSKD